ncbi:dephospho-CoA kinase [Terriglobus roseus]|uniref:Dephospho-CoA kinase n=1 Tax=Terriglobus roseus TaxID=392734 RepID=A0A1H4KI05_9BACT|nr:dephospho-CoA kinase [Terriglobus roseus]SEB57552.1 dephospho-CoA kinase [Terriglobus roseus]
MLRVGLTGGVGSGKSAAAAHFRTLGAQVSQSDEVGRALMKPGQPAFQAITQHFGPMVIAADGALDRAALARIAFEQGRVEEINAIVHPLVIAAQSAWAETVLVREPAAVAIVESALIFETRFTAHGPVTDVEAPWRTRFDRVVVVTAPLETRRERYIARQAGSMPCETASADFDRRAAAQWTDERKAALADFVLVNDGSLQHLQDEVFRLYALLRLESADRASEAM